MLKKINKEQAMLQGSIDEIQTEIEKLKKEEWNQDCDLQKIF